MTDQAEIAGFSEANADFAKIHAHDIQGCWLRDRGKLATLGEFAGSPPKLWEYRREMKDDLARIQGPELSAAGGTSSALMLPPTSWLVK